MLNRIKHFYFNKYLVSPLSKNKYYLSYCFEYKALWYRVPKVATRTIDQHFREQSKESGYIYSSRVGYIPSRYINYLKFAFVRNPYDRLVSAWKNKVIETNYFNFPREEYSRMKKFHEFIAWLEDQDIINIDEHFLPQHNLIDTNNLDFLGRFESFNHDFDQLAKKIGLPINTIHHKNPSEPIQLDISSSTKSRVEKLYSRDFQLFNY